MLTYELKKREGVPLYEELFEEIRRDITAGNLRDGERLPSKRSLAKHLNISVNTVEHAYLKLVEEEYVRSEKGRGFFVDSGTEWPDSPMKMGFHGWNVAAVRKREVRANDEDGAEDSETFSMDFKGNKCSVSLFPSSTWVKLMRSLLSGEDKELFEPIPYNGHLSLRRAIAEHLRRYKGMEVDPEAIIIGAGTEFLYRRLLEMMGPGTMVAFEDPGYKQLTQMCVNAGGLYSYIPMDDRGISAQVLEQSSADLVHLSPANHFPTGIVMDGERRREVLDWAYKAPFRYIIEDDYDSEFSGDSALQQPLYAMDEGERVIYMNTFSKSLVSSIRISYMILPRSLIGLYRRTMSFYACSASGFEQQTLASFISEGYFQRHLDRLLNYYNKKKKRFVEEVEASPFSGVSEILRSRAGTHLLIRVNTSMDDEKIKERASELKIHISLLSDYCNRIRPAYLRTLVINYAGMENEDITQAVSLLEKMFERDIDGASRHGDD